MTDDWLQVKQHHKDDFLHFAPRCLKIRTKAGKIEPFVLNKAQRYLHDIITDQERRTGKVRVIILKGRQQGCSTYIEARLYWKISFRKGVRGFILTHEQSATDNLFEMVSRYHDNNHPSMQPHVQQHNAKELYFDNLDSGYRVGTAGTRDVGRSQTIQYFHGSEVAFWRNADTHAAGILQAIPDATGTESVLESTANGIGNLYHTQWQLAEAGASEYIAVFIPWYWQDEYQREVPEDFALNSEDLEYQSLYDLTDEQMAWRQAKIVDLSAAGEDGGWRFKQEYPATAAEAFQTSGEDSLISPRDVLTARKTPKTDPHGPLIAGVDPSRFGTDRTSIMIRQGRQVIYRKNYTKKNTMEVAGYCANLFKDYEIHMMNIDVGGLGAGVVDRLVELGYGAKINAVNFGERPYDSERYVNRRAEMWGEMNQWLSDRLPVSIPDDDSLHADLVSPQYSYDSMGRLKLERKEDMKKRGLRSPDEGDALALTFAEPVNLDAAVPSGQLAPEICIA